MARTKNFDREVKLLAAMELFWHKGFADMLVADLVSHLGINRFILYNAYIPKPLEDADSEVSPDARARRNMMRMVIPFSNVTTQC